MMHVDGNVALNMSLDLAAFLTLNIPAAMFAKFPNMPVDFGYLNV
jgi:hypothetical protein